MLARHGHSSTYLKNNPIFWLATCQIVFFQHKDHKHCFIAVTKLNKFETKIKISWGAFYRIAQSNYSMDFSQSSNLFQSNSNYARLLSTLFSIKKRNL